MKVNRNRVLGTVRRAVIAIILRRQLARRWRRRMGNNNSNKLRRSLTMKKGIWFINWEISSKEDVHKYKTIKTANNRRLSQQKRRSFAADEDIF